MSIAKIKNELNSLKNLQQAKILACFFKTGKGQYGQGDIFLGIKVPIQRKIAQKYQDALSLSQTVTLLDSKIHEYRLTALIILVNKFKKGNEKTKEKIFKLYLKNTKHINNWDLVDLSAPNIIGSYLVDKDKSILVKLAKSPNLWKKRIAIISTICFIRNNSFSDTINIATILLADSHDLIHKAVGWMLREVGKKDKQELTRFLDKYCKSMPRTMLRYSIERLNPDQKNHYMQK